MPIPILFSKTNTNEKLSARYVLYIKCFTCIEVLSAAEGIEPNATQLRAQCLAAELFTNANSYTFTSAKNISYSGNATEMPNVY